MYYKESINQKLNNHLHNVGNRVSDLKKELREFTFNNIPDYSLMLTEITEGELLKMLVKISGTKKALEIGVFTGYSSICIAEGLPDDGILFAVDPSEEWTNIAKKYWEKAGLSNKIKFTLDYGENYLKKLVENKEVIDFAFVDANKTGYIKYFELLMQLVRPGGLIIFDNTLWGGEVYESDGENMSNEGKTLLELNKILHNDKRVEINQLAISDGVTIVRKL